MNDESASSETLEFVWACGLFEGEGTCGIVGNGTHASGRPNRTVSISLTMTDLDVIERFQRAVGCGVIDGPLTAGMTNKPLYRWRARGNRVAKADLMTRMLPWLGARRIIQAMAVIDYGAQSNPPSCEPDPITGIRPRLENREYCVNGHKVTPDSISVRPDGISQCRQCMRNNYARYRAKAKQRKVGQ